jgi:two-component system heavy metal sensor histidine kinase CusS
LQDASHELKTPLTILRGRAEILVASLLRGSDQQVMALELVEEVERMSEIVEKLLLLSRADAKSLLLDTQTHNFSTLMDDFLEDAAGFAPDLDLKTDIAPNIVWACDVALVRLLVQNLYTNAVKYNIPSGWIYFKLHSTPSHVVLRIENAATGIPQDLERNAFSRFYRLDDARSSSRSGHGLGLSICREIADLHNAKLDMTVLDDRVVMTLTFELVPAITI